MALKHRQQKQKLTTGTVTEVINRVKRQTTEREKVIVKHICDKELILKGTPTNQHQNIL